MEEILLKAKIRNKNIEITADKLSKKELEKYCGVLRDYKFKKRTVSRNELQEARRLLRLKRSKILTVSQFVKNLNSNVSHCVALDEGIVPYAEAKIYLRHKIEGRRELLFLKEPQRKRKVFKDGQTITYKTKGNAFFEKGTILRLYYKRVLKGFFLDKKPKSNRRYVGVELEFCSKMNEKELGILLYKNNLIEYCTWKLDHSLRPKEGEHGHELAILATEKKVTSVVRRVCKLLTEKGALAEDRRCGVHVHIDVRNRDKEKVYNNLVACQRWLMKMAPKSRRNSEFCRRVRSRKFPKNFNGSRRERYKTVNAASYYRHKTIEVRLHEGSLDYKSLNNWIKLLIKISNYGKKVDKTMPSIKKMVNTFSLNETYVRDRINKWKVLERSGRLETLSSASITLDTIEMAREYFGSLNTSN